MLIDGDERLLGQQSPGHAAAARLRSRREVPGGVLACDRGVGDRAVPVGVGRAEVQGAAAAAGEEQPSVRGEEGRRRRLVPARLGDAADVRHGPRQRRGCCVHGRLFDPAALPQMREEEQEAALAVGVALEPGAQRGIDERLQRTARLLPLWDRAVVCEQPGAAAKGMGVLERDPADARLPHMGDDCLGLHERRERLELRIAMRWCQAVDDARRAALEPAEAPAVGVLVALDAQGVGAVEQLVGDPAGHPGLRPEETTHGRAF